MEIVERLRRLAPYALDVALVGLAVAMEIELWTTEQLHHKWAISALAPLAVLPLIRRKTLPFVATMTVLAAILAMSLVDAHGLEPLDTAFVTILFTAWAIGTYNDRRHAIAGLAVLIVATGIVTQRFDDASIGDFFWSSAFFSGIWLAGFVLSRRSEHARELQELATRLEHEREEEARQAVAGERARIARELHDVVAHSVSVMVVQAGGVRRLLRDDQAREREALLVVEQIGRSALSEMRRMLGVLRTDGEQQDAALTPQPGLTRLDRLLEHARHGGLRVALRVEGTPRPLPPGLDLSAYRIVQEGLTNALKHASGASTEVTVRYAEGRVELEVTDDGPGPPNSDGMGHGLVGMRERVALYGGTLEAGPRAGGGYVLRAVLPFDGAVE